MGIKWRNIIFQTVGGIAALILTIKFLPTDFWGILLFFVIYGGSMLACSYGTNKLLEEGVAYMAALEKKQSYSASLPRLIGLSLLACSPFYLFILTFSLVPITSYEAWMITLFPCLLLLTFPLSELASLWKDVKRRRLIFWGIQIATFAFVMILAVAIKGSVVLSTL